MKNKHKPSVEQQMTNYRRSDADMEDHSASNMDINCQEIQQKPQLNASQSQNMLKNMKVRFIINTLIKKIRYLSPPHHVPDCIKEQWQSSINDEYHFPQKTKEYTKQTLTEQLSHKFQLFRHINLLEGVMIVLFCWLITISIVFQERIGFEILLMILTVSLVKFSFVLIAWAVKDLKQETFQEIFFEDLYRPLFISFTVLMFLLRFQFDLGAGAHIIEILGLVAAVLQYKHIEVSFQNVVKYAEHNKMKKQLRILELSLLIITLAHVFGLIMYATVYFPVDEENWLEKFKIDDKEWHIQYIYCFYWAMTTMVTVGYGDITPANHYEVLVVMCIELIGTAVFGYMINVIGITVDQIKKKNEQFDNYQQTIDKLRDYYQLSRELCHKMKHDIKQKQNEFKNIPLKTSEEKDFLDYIQPTLKEEFVLETNMKVIKKSIFFLTHFSVNFQNEIALKLIRIIYKPGEQILINDSELTQRNLVIINNGSADIFIENNHNNISILKKVREIKPSENSLVMNVYGYSALIVNRNVRLRAIAKQTAVTYVLRRKDILECMDKSMLDFESFNQLREKMTFFKMLEEVEAPSLKENEKHFIPNIFLIQKKITYENQSRLIYSRNVKRTKLKLITCKNYGNKTIPKINDDNQAQLEGNIIMLEDEDLQSLRSFQSNKNGVNFVFKDEGIVEKLRMDQCKVYENFMKGSNLPIIAAAYEKSCQKKTYRRRFRTSLITERKQPRFMSFIQNFIEN